MRKTFPFIIIVIIIIVILNKIIVIIVIINEIISIILSSFQERSAERVSNYELYAGHRRCCQNKGEHVVCFDLAWIYVIVLIYNAKNVFVL